MALHGLTYQQFLSQQEDEVKLMKQFLRVDEQGYYIEPVILELVKDDEGNEVYPVDDYMVGIPFENGMYKPRWTGTEWIDEITQEELDEGRILTEKQRLKEFLEGPPSNERLGYLIIDSDIDNLTQENKSVRLGNSLIDNDIQNIILEKENLLLKEQNLMLGNKIIDMDLELLDIKNKVDAEGENPND